MTLAKITDRFLAYLLDTVPFAVGFYASLYALVVAWGLLPATNDVWRWVLAAWVALYLLYHAVGNAFGGTPGKRLLGLRVVTAGGGPPGAAQSVARALGLVLSTPVVNLGFLWALWQPESRAWHDLIAGTWVVEARPKSPAAALASALLSLALLAAAAGSTAWFYLMRPTPADLEAVARARLGLEILAQVQERHKAADGAYTDSLAELARASGDAAQFKEGMSELFEKDGFVLEAGQSRWRIQARAKDRRRTVVVREGP